MRWFINLKLKNKIILFLIFVIAIKCIPFTVAYKGMENITSIKELQSNMIIALLFSIVITIVLGLLLINLICKPMKKLNDIAKNIVDGDFNETIEVKANDEIGELANLFKIILKSVRNLIDDSNLILNSVEKGNFNINLNESKYNGAWKCISENNLRTTNIFIENIRTTSNYIDKISKGETSTKYQEEETGEFNIAKNNINKLIDNLNMFVGDIHCLKETFKAGNTRDKIDISKFQGIYKEMAECLNDTTWISIEVFIKLFAVIKAYSKGDFSAELEKFPGRYGLVNEHIEDLRSNLLNISVEQINIVNEIKQGNLSKRVDTSKFSGSWAEMIYGINGLIDAFVEPINVTADYLNRISNGDVPEKIVTIYHGEFNKIKNNLNILIDNLNMFVKDVNWMNETFKLGNTRDKIDVSKFNGVYKQMAQSVNDGMWISIDVLVKLFAVLKSYAQGDFSVQLEKLPGRYGIANESVENLRGNLLNISKEQINIANEIKQGNLSKRVEASKFSGSWAEMIDGINELIEKFVEPIAMTADYVKRISNGDIPPKITDIYLGDFNEIKNNLNSCIDNITALVTDANVLSKAATEGILDKRADETKHSGDFRKIVEGVNELIEAMVKPIQEVTSVMSEIAKGNLEVPVSGVYKGEFGVLENAVNVTEERLKSIVGEIADILGEISKGNVAIENVQEFDGNFKSISISLNKIVDSLNEVLGEINTSSDQVYTGASQVSDGSQALSQGATEQASAIEELTSSITEVAAQTKENAINANQAKELALHVKENAEEGNKHMSEMLKSMGEINESSANISKIIKVIDEIAFQTNILALNAAVEAARAGQHGKGFAVVAEEVRNLAARSANAAKETTDLIEGSIKKAEKGTEIANNTAKALYEIVEGVSKAATLVAEIAASSNEQATGISQINLGIEQVSQVVQTNSATAEESAAASEELSSQSELLKGMVSAFKLKNVNSNRYLNKEAKNHKNKQAYSKEINIPYKEAAVAEDKPKIALSDNEFGKY